MVIVNMPNIPPLIEGLRKLRLPEECDPRSHTGWDGRPCDPVASNAAAPAEAKHLSIVVLPFTNLSGDPSQDYFADGITENLTTDLSRIRNSFVIARNTAFTFKGKTIDAKEIGKELGVRYILEGSAQRDQNRVRVNAQLIDAESGAHLWADRFDEDVADLFKLQDQVVARLGNAFGFELVKAEAEKSARSNNPDAIDLAMRGWATMWRSYPQPPKEKRDSHYVALALFDRALKADPNDADALAGEAFTYMALFAFGEAAEANLDGKIIDPADRTIALAPDSCARTSRRAFISLSRAVRLRRRAAQGGACGRMSETRKLAAILVSDVVGYSGLAGADEDRILARLRTLRSDLIDPTIVVHHGRIVKRTGDGSIIEFRSVVDAVNCAIEIQRAMVERNAEIAPEKRIEFRVGNHVGDVVEEADGDLMGDGINIAARQEGFAKPGTICLSEDAYRQEADRHSGCLSFCQRCRMLRYLQAHHIFSAGRQAGNETP
jgi:TolB-like protein/class 3 adenylate cyclase